MGDPDAARSSFPRWRSIGTPPIVFDDFELTSHELDAWRNQRAAAVLGVGLAERLGWKRGDHVALVGTIPPYFKLEFQVVGITHASAYPNTFGSLQIICSIRFGRTR